MRESARRDLDLAVWCRGVAVRVVGVEGEVKEKWKRSEEQGPTGTP